MSPEELLDEGVAAHSEMAGDFVQNGSQRADPEGGMGRDRDVVFPRRTGREPEMTAGLSRDFGVTGTERPGTVVPDRSRGSLRRR